MAMMLRTMAAIIPQSKLGSTIDAIASGIILAAHPIQPSSIRAGQLDSHKIKKFP
jgi:hypothetical protein